MSLRADDRFLAVFPASYVIFGLVSGKKEKGRENALTGGMPLTIIRRLIALVAQLDRVSGYEPEGRGFESLPAHHLVKKPA